jgi:hypothetical protein
MRSHMNRNSRPKNMSGRILGTSKRQLPGRPSRRPYWFGLSTLEVIVVVSVICLGLAAFWGANALSSQQDEVRQARRETMHLEAVVRAFERKTGRLPGATEGLGVLIAPPGRIQPLLKQIEPDPWGASYIYRSPGPFGRSFEVCSAGQDLEVQTDDDICGWRVKRDRGR